MCRDIRLFRAENGGGRSPKLDDAAEGGVAGGPEGRAALGEGVGADGERAAGGDDLVDALGDDGDLAAGAVGELDRLVGADRDAPRRRPVAERDDDGAALPRAAPVG